MTSAIIMSVKQTFVFTNSFMLKIDANIANKKANTAIVLI